MSIARRLIYLAVILLLAVPLESFVVSPLTFLQGRHSRHGPLHHAAQRLEEQEEDPLIPREFLFENPDYRDPALSPDGKYLAYLAPAADLSFPYIYLRNLTDGSSSENKEDRQVTNGTARGLSYFLWAQDSRTIFYLLDTTGRENQHLWVIDALDAHAEARDLTPFDNVKVQTLITNRHQVDQVLIGTNQRDSAVFDIYRCYFQTGELLLDTLNPGNVVGWGADENSFRIRQALVRNQADSSTALLIRKDVDNDEWQEMYTWPYGEEGTFVDFVSNDACYITSSVGRDTTALFLMNFTTGDMRLISSNEKCDCGQVVLDKDTKLVRAVSYTYARTEWVFMDPHLQHDFDALSSQGSDVRVWSKSRDETLWVADRHRSDGPTEFVLYNQTARTAMSLFCSRPGLLRYPLVAMEDVRIKARDGLELVAYLTRAKVNQPTPLILLVHGGPWTRDYWEFSPTAQWFANRGYATLQVNFRGSTGYGKAFKNKGDRGWGVGGMQHDLTDSVQWAVQQGIADPRKICIYGGSYGGYACLAGLAFTPEVYACGVDIVGPSNVKTLLDSIPSYWGPLRNQTLRRIGDVDMDEDFNRRISPLFHVDKIKAPLLIAHGSNDVRVKQAEADQIAFAMHERGIPVQYVVYPNEGHGIRRPQNRVDFSGRVERFLQEHLGGRAAVFNLPEGSTATFPLSDQQA